jgi:hypothetical protein
MNTEGVINLIKAHGEILGYGFEYLKLGRKLCESNPVESIWLGETDFNLNKKHPDTYPRPDINKEEPDEDHIDMFLCYSNDKLIYMLKLYKPGLLDTHPAREHCAFKIELKQIPVELEEIIYNKLASIARKEIERQKNAEYNRRVQAEIRNIMVNIGLHVK